MVGAWLRRGRGLAAAPASGTRNLLCAAGGLAIAATVVVLVAPFSSDLPDGLESALWRAIGCYYQFPDHFRQLMINGMRCDYSWKGPAEHYLKIYDYIRDK